MISDINWHTPVTHLLKLLPPSGCDICISWRLPGVYDLPYGRLLIYRTCMGSGGFTKTLSAKLCFTKTVLNEDKLCVGANSSGAQEPFEFGF